MSASLVGSEMCIRHSVKSGRGARKRWLARACGAAAFPSCRGRKGAVSYTHLTLPTICSV
eukprot:12887126-Alexandrium_andersonii.AAC.1